MKVGGHEFHVGIDRGQFCEGGVPILVEVVRARVDALVGGEFFLGKVKEQWHGVFLGLLYGG